MPRLQKRDGKLRLVNRRGLSGLPESKILALDTPEFEALYTDCCCGYDFPTLYQPLYACKTGERIPYVSSGLAVNATYWHVPTRQCVWTPGQNTVTIGAGEQFSGEPHELIDLGSDFGWPTEGGCDHPICTGEQPPPDPGPDPTDPGGYHFPPFECGDCGTTTPPNPCDLCTCKPVSKVRVAVSGTTNCLCVGPCSATTFQYSRIADGDTADGIVDMDPVGTCEWIGAKAIYLMDGQVGDPPGVTCHNGPNVYSVSYHLKKLTKTLYVFSVYVNTMSPYDPRDYDPADNTYNWRFFVGFATVEENSCMGVPTMQNFMACQCESSATSDGRFGLATGGQAVFDTCAS
jgi:hypothetical protein